MRVYETEPKVITKGKFEDDLINRPRLKNFKDGGKNLAMKINYINEFGKIHLAFNSTIN